MSTDERELCLDPGPRVGESRPTCVHTAGHLGDHAAHRSWGPVCWSNSTAPAVVPVSADDTPPRVWWDRETPGWLLVDRGEGRNADVEVWRPTYQHQGRGLPDGAVELHAALATSGVIAEQGQRIRDLSRLLRGMARRASRYRRKLHLAAQDAARHHAAATETSEPATVPHFMHTQEAVEEELRGAGHGDMPDLADVVFVATSAARRALGACSICDGTGTYPADVEADGYPGPECCPSCEGTGWADPPAAPVPASPPSPAEVASRLSAAAEVCERHQHHGLAYEFSQIASQLDEDGYSAEVCAAVARALSGLAPTAPEPKD